MPTLTLPFPSFQPFTKILSAQVNANNTAITTLLNVTGLDSTNVQLNGLSRDRLALGTVNHVMINSGTGAVSSEAQLGLTRGGTGISISLSVADADKVLGVNAGGTALEIRAAPESSASKILAFYQFS